MIIKGSEHDNAANLARYLLNPKKGEKQFVMELRDTASDDLKKSLTDWETIGRCMTKGNKVLYHAHIRLRDGEVLHEGQWFKVVEDLESKLGFTNCPRAVIGHNNAEKGLHVHVVWSRVDPTRKPLVQLGNDHKHHHDVARAAEKEFNLTPAVELNKKHIRKRKLSNREVRAMKDRNINREKLEKIVRAAWNATDSGEEMKAMLGALGVQIKPGDRRDWVVEYMGLKMNPVRLLEGVDTFQYRQRMKDVDHEAAKGKAREASTGETVARKARQMTQHQIDKSIANDSEAQPKAKTGFTRVRRAVPQPRLKRKLRFDDPGI